MRYLVINIVIALTHMATYANDMVKRIENNQVFSHAVSTSLSDFEINQSTNGMILDLEMYFSSKEYLSDEFIKLSGNDGGGGFMFRYTSSKHLKNAVDDVLKQLNSYHQPYFDSIINKADIPDFEKKPVDINRLRQIIKSIKEAPTNRAFRKNKDGFNVELAFNYNEEQNYIVALEPYFLKYDAESISDIQFRNIKLRIIHEALHLFGIGTVNDNFAAILADKIYYSRVYSPRYLECGLRGSLVERAKDCNGFLPGDVIATQVPLISRKHLYLSEVAKNQLYLSNDDSYLRYYSTNLVVKKNKLFSVMYPQSIIIEGRYTGRHNDGLYGFTHQLDAVSVCSQLNSKYKIGDDRWSLISVKDAQTLGLNQKVHVIDNHEVKIYDPVTDSVTDHKQSYKKKVLKKYKKFEVYPAICVGQ